MSPGFSDRVSMMSPYNIVTAPLGEKNTFPFSFVGRPSIICLNSTSCPQISFSEIRSILISSESPAPVSSL